MTVAAAHVVVLLAMRDCGAFGVPLGVDIALPTLRLGATPKTHSYGDIYPEQF